ncbi:glycosyltransferase family 2 protein [uncultured Kordia sp.]|uniref:glycosyltransferase family 2 protein n=1 Tax=uncultured Kordia sp. TaxID=507699 RepID=UPI002626E1CF|nr:glycosyltransferase family 2 protein [uncultured Kordia sp.]
MIPKVSIIIPVYNTEKYLKKSLNSAINQTLKELDIVIVDDKSTDNSLQIIQEFQKKDDRITVIALEKNRGNGFGRNSAIQKASAPYIMFLDSDDWLEPNAVEIVYNEATRKQSEVLIFGYFEVKTDKKGNIINTYPVLPTLEDGATNFIPYYLSNRKGFSSAAWSYIFSRDHIIHNEVKFTENIFFEDIEFVSKAVIKAKRIDVYKEQALYSYLRRPSSITSSFSKKKIKDLYQANHLLSESLKKEGIYKIYEKDYMLRFVIECVHWSFLDYMHMPSRLLDNEVKKFMKTVKNDFITDENLELVKSKIDTMQSDEIIVKTTYQNMYDTLVLIKNNPIYFKYRLFTTLKWLSYYRFFTKYNKIIKKAEMS